MKMLNIEVRSERKRERERLHFASLGSFHNGSTIKETLEDILPKQLN
jgi:hypothetical protein